MVFSYGFPMVFPMGFPLSFPRWPAPKRPQPSCATSCRARRRRWCAARRKWRRRREERRNWRRRWKRSIWDLLEDLLGFSGIYDIRRPRPTQGGARQGIRHFPPTIWKLATATATATAAAAVLFCAMVFSRPGPTFLQQPAAGAAGRQQQSSQQSRSR